MSMDAHDGFYGLVPDTVCGCSWRRVIHIIDAGLLIAVQVLQGSILNYYIIAHYSSSVLPYFWFVGDFLCLFVFAGTLTISYKYFNRITTNVTSDGTSFKLSPTRIIDNFPTSRLGVLPLSYVSWLFYAGILVGKVAVIFKSEIPGNLLPENMFGPQLLQVTIAMGAIVFLLLAESHNWAKHRSPRYQFVTSTCAHSGLAVLDTVSLLSALLPQAIRRSSDPPAYLEDIILFLSLINLLLPALALHRLGLSEPSAEKCEEHLMLPFNVLYNLAHLVMVDVPFLLVRSYLWIGHGQHTSLFMMKNILGILVTLRSLHPDISELTSRKLHPQPPTNNPQMNKLLEMQNLGEGKSKSEDHGNGTDIEEIRDRDIAYKAQ